MIKARAGKDLAMTEPSYIIVLPWPPSTNTYYRSVLGRTILSSKAREFKTAVQACVLSNGPIPHFDGRLKVLIKLAQPTRKVIDIDNRIKPTLDALVNAGVMDDDSQVDELTVVRIPIVKDGKCFVYIWEI